MPTDARIPLKTKLGFGAGDLGNSVFFTAASIWLLIYLTDEIGLSAGLAGLVLLLTRIWAALVDPVIGHLSDRTRTRWGRRRPWLLFGALPFGAATAVLFINPGLDGNLARFIWALVAYIIASTAAGAVALPYGALLPELTTNYDERTRTNGYRTAFSLIGTLIGAGAVLPVLAWVGDRTQGYIVVGAIFGAIIVTSALVTFATVRERHSEVARPEKQTLTGTIQAIASNPPYKKALFAWAAISVGITVVMGALPYYCKYVLLDESFATHAIITLLVAALLSTPLAVKAAEMLGKRNTYALGVIAFAVALLIIFVAGLRVPVLWRYAILALAGMGVSTNYVVPWAMLPDTIEFDYANTGLRREGVYYGVWMMLTKVALAIGGLVQGLTLASFGYVADVSQSSTSILGIRLLIGPVPVTFLVIGVFFLASYSLNKREYETLQERIAVRDGR